MKDDEKSINYCLSCEYTKMRKKKDALRVKKSEISVHVTQPEELPELLKQEVGS